jgi:hypothetical protein
MHTLMHHPTKAAISRGREQTRAEQQRGAEGRSRAAGRRGGERPAGAEQQRGAGAAGGSRAAARARRGGEQSAGAAIRCGGGAEVYWPDRRGLEAHAVVAATGRLKDFANLFCWLLFFKAKAGWEAQPKGLKTRGCLDPKYLEFSYYSIFCLYLVISV